MSKHEFSAKLDQPADAIFALLTDLDRHNRILPFCKGVTVSDRQSTDGVTRAVMRHAMAIARIGFDADVQSRVSYRTSDRSFETQSGIGDAGASGLKTVGHVAATATGSELRLSLDTDGLPLRYRIMLIEPVLRRAFDKFVDKLSRRAAELAASGAAS